MTTHAHLWHKTITILLIATIVCAGPDDPRVTWHYPTGKPSFFLSDVLNASYTTPYPDPRIGLWCVKIGDTGQGKVLERNGSPGTGWTLITFDRIDAPVSSCFLIIWEDQPNGDNWDADHTAGHGQTSNSFNVQFIRQAAATSGLSVPAPVTTSSQSPAATSPAASQPANQSQSNVPQAAGINTGAIAGIVIGATAISLVLGGLAVLFWRRWRIKSATKKSQAVSKERSPESFNCRCHDSEFWSLEKKHAGYAPRELGDTGNYRPHELSS